MIVEILESTLGFKSTTHERNIYLGKVKDEIVYICQQVDDFAIASNSIAVGKYIIAKIDKKVTTSSKGIGTEYNGIDVQQTQNYIKLHCKSYIEKVLLSHGWTEPSPSELMRHNIVPISPDTVSHLQNLTGPLEHTKEHLEIENKAKFSYQGLLGELLYSYIVIHVEIGNATVPVQILFFSTYGALYGT